jgi:hypothetical protein
VLAATTAGTNISASYNAASETLTLSGTDTLANYQGVLRSVTFASSSQDPTQSGADLTRTVSWIVNDGSARSGFAAMTVNISRLPVLQVSDTMLVGSGVHGEQLPLSSLVTVSDPDHVGFQKLELWDSNGTVTGSQFVINGVPQTGGHEIDLAPADIANTYYDVGTLGGTDTMWAQLMQYNGQLTGWQQFWVSSPVDTPPTVSVANLTATPGKIFAASSLFTASDPDGDTLTQYGFLDTGTGGGHFVLNGVAQAVNQEIDVSAAQLSQLTYQAGTTGTDTLQVRAYDGTQWSNWSNSFTVTPLTVAVTTSNSDVNLAHNTATISFSFSEAPTDFSLSHVSATGGALSNLTQVDATHYSATFTGAATTDTGSASVVVDSAWHDVNGTTGGGSSSGNFTVDTVTPTVAVTTSNSDVNLAHNTATISFSFSEAPADFSLSHASATGGTLSNLTQVDATHYSATFTGAATTDTGSASVVVDSAWHEANGNPGSGGSSGNFTVDTVTPTVAVTTSNSALTLSNNTATVTFTFNEAPNSFALADTSAVGGTLSNLQKISPTKYTATFTAAGNTLTSNASVNVIAGSWQEASGNPGAAGSTGSFTVDTLDHWRNTSGGGWTTASSWSNGVPSAAVKAAIDAIGSYAVSITTADTAYALLLNDSGGTVSDNKGGTLTLVGAGGSTNPNGTLMINAGTFALAGGTLKSGSITIGSGANLLVSASYSGLANAITDGGSITISGNKTAVTFTGNLSGSGAINVQNNGTVTFNGAAGSETFNISGTSKAIVNSTANGTGSFVLSGSGSVEFGAADSENVSFTAGATGTVKVDHSLTALFTGKLSGLSTTGNNFVDLADLTFASGKMTASYSGTTSGGVLTVSNGTNKATLNLLGNYVGNSWILSKDSGTGTLVADPAVTGSVHPEHWASSHSALSDRIALLTNYMASAFPSSGIDGSVGSLASDVMNHQQFLARPHG